MLFPLIARLPQYILQQRCLLTTANRTLSPFAQNELQKTGTFRTNIPDVFPPPTHYRRALKTLHTVKVDEKIKNIASRKRKYTSQIIIKLMTSLTAPLTEVLKSIQRCMAHLHPYERVVATLTLNTREKAGHKPLHVRRNIPYISCTPVIDISHAMSCLHHVYSTSSGCSNRSVFVLFPLLV